MQQIIITGSLGRDAEMREAGGQSVCSFSVASSQGFGDRKTTNWFRCNLWGARGSKLAPYLLKGGKLTVAGDLTIGEYQGKPQFDINVSQVELMGDGGQRQQAKPQQREQPRTIADDELDSDVPF